MSNVGGVLVGYTCWGCFGWKIMSVIHSAYVCAFTKNHTILYNKHVYINNNWLSADHYFAIIDSMVNILLWGKISL